MSKPSHHALKALLNFPRRGQSVRAFRLRVNENVMNGLVRRAMVIRHTTKSGSKQYRLAHFGKVYAKYLHRLVDSGTLYVEKAPDGRIVSVSQAGSFWSGDGNYPTSLRQDHANRSGHDRM